MSCANNCILESLNQHITEIESAFEADAIAIYGPIMPGLDHEVKQAVEKLNKHEKRSVLVVIHDTFGGIVQVVERMVTTIRHFYQHVYFVIPDKAMSAGTIFVMSGDKIYMNYFSCLGPIDPQIEVNGSMVSAVSYLNQYENLKEKSISQPLSQAEYILLDKLDLGQLYEFDQARQLSIDLLKEWLSKYKFKDWNTTESSQHVVDVGMRTKRAEEVANMLSRNDHWHSHARGIDMKTLQSEAIKLKIDDLELNEKKANATYSYHELLMDFMLKNNLRNFVHTKFNI